MVAAFFVFCLYAAYDWLWEYPALVAVALGGVAIAAAASSERIGRPPRVSIRATATVAAFLLGATQIPGIVGTSTLRDSEDALAAGDIDRARSAASDAIDARPWAASPLAQRALVEESAGEFAQARDDLRDAREREPTNWLWAAQLSRVEMRLGNAAAAAAAGEEADRLNRSAP